MSLDVERQEPTVRVSLGDLLPLVALAHRTIISGSRISSTTRSPSPPTCTKSSAPSAVIAPPPEPARLRFFVIRQIGQQLRFAELTEIDLAAYFAFHQFQPRIQFAQTGLDDVQFRREVVARSGRGTSG